jgi:hypothetical protein
VARPGRSRATRPDEPQDIFVTETVGMTGLPVRLIFIRKPTSFLDNHDPRSNQNRFEPM